MHGKISKTTWLFFAAALLALALGLGCATGGPQTPPSGYLLHHDELKPDPTIKGLWYWEKPGVEWKAYNRLLIGRVQVKIDKSASKRDLKPGEAKKLARKLRAAVMDALKGTAKLANRPGPGVLLVEAALVHLKPVNPTMNVVSSAIFMWPMDIGEAAVEVKFLDSLSKQLLGEMVIQSTGGHSEVTQVWTRWTQVENDFAEWAQMLKESIQSEQKKHK